MEHLEFLADLSKKAGKAILEVYETDFDVQKKADRSPLTEADTRSHQIISRALRDAYPDIPVLSEEGKEIDYAERKSWEKFWLVDPLDGTKEFVKRNGEFTVNIALIELGRPIWGVIYIPVPDMLYVADTSIGAWCIKGHDRHRIRVASQPADSIRIVKSRSHPSPQLETILELLPEHEIITRGSALKFCAVAAGDADFYPRLGPTWEWDTAAGQAIVNAAGGIVVDFAGRPITYNKPSLLNGPFLVCSNANWLKQKGILNITASMNLA